MKKSKLLLLSLLLMAVSLMSACGGNGNAKAGEDKPEELKKVRVAYMPNMGSASAPFILQVRQTARNGANISIFCLYQIL